MTSDDQPTGRADDGYKWIALTNTTVGILHPPPGEDGLVSFEDATEVVMAFLAASQLL